MLAVNYIHKGIGVLSSDEKVSVALDIMSEQKINYLAIVENDTFLGIISENSLLELPSTNQKIAANSFLLKKLSVQANQHIYDAAKLAYLENIDIIPVVDENNTCLGCITLQNLIKAFSLITAVAEEGTIITLKINATDLYTSEIAHIIESNDAKIINMYITPIPHTQKIELTIKINKTDIGRIIQTFNRYNYTVDIVFQQNLYNDDLEDKYKSFMKYLSI